MNNKEYLQLAAQTLEMILPDNHGFILFAFPFGENPDNRLAYVSNAKREDAINALKEWLLKAGASEDWMQHIK